MLTPSVLASLNATAFRSGYVIGAAPPRIPTGGWKEIFNSGAAVYGGANISNSGSILQVSNGQTNAIIPAHGFVLLEKVS